MRSRVYRSPPYGGAQGPEFLNAVVLLDTDVPDLQAALRRIEEELGRERPAPPNAPRPIDLDLLWEAGAAPDPAELALPHVVVPLADVAPDLRGPATGQTVGELARGARETTDIAPRDIGTGGPWPPVPATRWDNATWDRGHPYAWRTWLRGRLPWFLIDWGVADKGRDCTAAGGWHRWYNQDDDHSACYHCKVVEPGQPWRDDADYD
jgi:2-amino-4-hydroxy-6-hydroxymethyldihydropteridine diphosphokinase